VTLLYFCCPQPTRRAWKRCKKARGITRRRLRRCQTSLRLAEERRRLYGHYTRLMEELRVEDPHSFFNYLRMKSAKTQSGHSDRIWSGLSSWFSIESDQYVSNSIGMSLEYLECSQSALRIGLYLECRSIFLHFECISKVLSMSKTFRRATWMGMDVWNAHRLQFAIRNFRMHWISSNIGYNEFSFRLHRPKVGAFRL